MDLKLDGRVVLVTGASVGIGRTTAKDFAREGAQLVIVARRADQLASLADEIETDGHLRPLCIDADITDLDTPARLRDAVDNEFGRLDVLVNNAGGAERPGVKLDEAIWQSQFELNFHSKRRLAEAFLTHLRASDQGRIINFVGLLEPAVISPAQAAVAACILWAKALARVTAPDGVTVNCIAPGRIESEQVQVLYPTAESRQAFIDERIPAGRFGTMEEASALVLFLASGPASYITGDMFSVDGGMHRSI